MFCETSLSAWSRTFAKFGNIAPGVGNMTPVTGGGDMTRIPLGGGDMTRTAPGGGDMTRTAPGGGDMTPGGGDMTPGVGDMTPWGGDMTRKPRDVGDMTPVTPGGGDKTCGEGDLGASENASNKSGVSAVIRKPVDSSVSVSSPSPGGEQHPSGNSSSSPPSAL